jgi:uncharacterized protein (TIGR00251 family)
MKLHIKLHPNSSQEKIEKLSEAEYEVWIKEKPIDGKANEELIKILKKYFKKPVEITSGFTSKNKIVNIE